MPKTLSERFELEADRDGARACWSDFLQVDGAVDAAPGLPGRGMANAGRGDAYGLSGTGGAPVNCQIAAIARS